MDTYDPESCDDVHVHIVSKKEEFEDLTLMYVFVSIIVLSTFLFVVVEQDDVKNLRDFCLSNL
jgi:hypothetical protein